VCRGSARVYPVASFAHFFYYSKIIRNSYLLGSLALFDYGCEGGNTACTKL